MGDNDEVSSSTSSPVHMLEVFDKRFIECTICDNTLIHSNRPGDLVAVFKVNPEILETSPFDWTSVAQLQALTGCDQVFISQGLRGEFEYHSSIGKLMAYFGVFHPESTVNDLTRVVCELNREFRQHFCASDGFDDHMKAYKVMVDQYDARFFPVIYYLL